MYQGSWKYVIQTKLRKVSARARGMKFASATIVSRFDL